MFLFKMSVASVPMSSNKYMQSNLYKFSRELNQNTILNRSVLELLGADFPSTLTELVGRGWKSAADTFARTTLYFLNSFLIPVLFMPVLNSLSKSSNSLPDDFKKHFHTQLTDLVPEMDTDRGNQEFIQKLIKLEGKEAVEKFLGSDESKHSTKITEYKKQLVKAKASVMKMDLLCDGTLTYITPWIVTWFTKNVLGIVGYGGENTYLDDSQLEESIQLHEKTKFFKFGGGLLATIFGGQWFAKKVIDVASSKNEDIDKKTFGKFVKKNLKHFDYLKGIYSNKLNLAGTFLFGGDAGFLLSCRSLNEVIEKSLRVIVFWPTMIFGVEWVNSILCQHSDKKNGTSIVHKDKPKDLGVLDVKGFDELENELIQAEAENNVTKIEKSEKALKSRVNNFWYSILIDAAVMGVGLSAANIIGTKIRIQKFGIY